MLQVARGWGVGEGEERDWRDAMLIKEYRIPLPLTVDEYRIAQLFMIAVSVRYMT